MTLQETTITGLYLIKPVLFKDARGYFFEGYNSASFAKEGFHFNFIQDNQSKSAYGVIRGLHFQRNPKAQTKLVRVLQGAIYDVAVDLRVGSPTFGKWFGAELSDENCLQMLIPKGFAHGFSVISETAVVFYKCDEFYSPGHDAGISFNDPLLNIDWGIPTDKVLISDKDRMLPEIKQVQTDFIY